MPLASRILVAGLISALAGCAGLPVGVDRPPSSAYVDTGGTRLGRALAGAVAAHPGKTGVAAAAQRPRRLRRARCCIARAAERSLDVQYYIWHADTTGNLMFEALWQAAERGVRVRLLLDDENTRGLDPTLAALDAHPEHRGAAVQPVREPRVRASATSRRLRAPEPPHAQQVVHRRQPGRDRRRPQHRRRVLRGRQRRSAFADLDVVVDRARSCATSRRSSTPTGTARPPIRSPACVPAADAGRRGARCAMPGRTLQRQPGGGGVHRGRARDRRSCSSCVAGTLALEWVSARAGQRRSRQGRCTRPSARDMQMLPRLQAGDGPAERRTATSSRPTSCRRRKARRRWSRIARAA